MRSDRNRLRPDANRVMLACERLEERETPAAGALDPAFGAGGHVWDARIQGDLRAVALQPDGKIVAAGVSRTSTGTAAAVARFNANGTPDRTFDADGLLTLDFGRHRGTAAAVAVQADGKVVIAGDDGGDGLHVARFNADGTFDRTFDADGQAFTAFGGLGVSATGLAVQADGKIVVVGRGTPTNGSPGRAVLARFNRDGTLDRTFDGDGQAVTTWGSSALSADAVAVQSDGKLVVAGTIRSGTTTAIAVLRYTTGGLLDTSFAATGGNRTAFRYTVGLHTELAVQTDGKVVVAGAADILRYNRDGSLDTRFGVGGTTTTTLANAAGVAVQADGTILVAGTSSVGTNPTNVALVRLTAGGVMDRTFDGDGRVVADLGGRDSATALALTTGKVVVAAASTNAAGAAGGVLARFLTTDATTPVPTPGRTTTTLTASASSAQVGQSVTLTAVVSATTGSATGTVTFRDGATVLGIATLSGGRAVFTTSGLTAGAHTLTAVYNGATGLVGSTSAALPLAVIAPTAKSTTTALTASASPTAGRPVTLTAAVTVIGGGTATGSVTFRDGTNVLGTATLSSGRAVLTTSSLVAGSHQLKATYGGAMGIASSTSAALALTVAPAVVQVATQTALAASLGSAFYGQPVTFTATVRSTVAGAPTPTGSVTFKDGTVTVGTVALTGGSASLVLSTLRGGAHSLTAVYNSDLRSAASTSAARALTVNKALTVVDFTLSPDVVASGATLTLRATVRALAPSAAVPSGQIIFKADDVVLGTVTLDRTGTATLSVPNTLAVKQHWIAVGYFGTDSFAPDASGGLLTVVLR